MATASPHASAAYDGRPAPSDTEVTKHVLDDVSVTEKTLTVVASAEAYAMVAGGLMRACEAALSKHREGIAWTQVHMRIVSDNVPFKFEAQQLMEVVKEQKQLNSLRMVGSKKKMNTAHRVLADLAYVVGRLDMDTSRRTVVVCLLKDASLARETETFMRQIVPTGCYPDTVFLDATSLALRWPHAPDTKDADHAHARTSIDVDASHETGKADPKNADIARSRTPNNLDVSHEMTEAPSPSGRLETERSA
ncbi:hypothetical protein CYMTET_4102 [Cymbomonas tetramitiformis]|uniref:Uncharacterized protein n=1 Tax=Cymbomonas tetramitiformis TaxID=36881 RepID=A0AAE0H223_9CHLO|nr:hypothetical protein CYMTET_4102 [Cymbomonas tetramitiformis]